MTDLDEIMFVLSSEYHFQLTDLTSDSHSELA